MAQLETIANILADTIQMEKREKRDKRKRNYLMSPATAGEC